MRKNRYPGIYARRKMLWMKYTDSDGTIRRESTQLPIGKEKEAAAMRRGIISRIAQEKAANNEDGCTGPMTLARYFPRWVDARVERGLISARDDRTRFAFHIAKREIATMPLEDIAPVHVRDFLRELISEKKLASRTLRNMYGMLHTLFVDPTWRASAVFTPSEVELLISSEKIDPDRRMLNALKFLSGARWGETVALRWRHLDPHWMGGPLGRLLVAESYQWQTNTIKATKTEVPRWVPVHPTLARMLAEWKLGGWAELMGRAPEADDLIIPPVPWRKQKTNVCRPPQAGLRAFHDDCKAVGIRTRRNHDSRRTFISLARAGGARLDLLTWITHGPSASVMDAYTTVPWVTLCEQVQAVKIRLREGKVLRLPVAVGGTRQGTHGGNSATMVQDSLCALQDSNLCERS